MFQSVPISESIRALWLANADLSAAVPGGLLYGILKVPSEKPYARLLITLDGEPDEDSGNQYIQTYRVRIDVWGDASLPHAGEIQRLLETLITAHTKFSALNRGAWTLMNWLAPASIVEEEERRNAANVFVAGAIWLCEIQENRSVP